MAKTTCDTQDNNINAVEPYALPAQLDAANAQDFYESLQHYLESEPRDYILDGSAVERMTTPSVQILIALAQHAHANDINFQLTNASSTLTDALQTLGLDDRLTMWSA